MNAPRWGFLRLLALATLLAGRLMAAQITLTVDTRLGPTDLGYDGMEVTVDHATLTVGGAHQFAGLVLQNGAVLTHDPAPSGQPEAAVRLVVAGQLTVDATSRIDVSGRGYAEPGSPGAGAMGNYAGSGGGHGGLGSGSNGISAPGGGAFGSILDPDEWGGPGGNSDSTGAFVPGGGLIHLDVGGVLIVDGAIRADGAGAWINNQGGGAGGSIWLRAATLAGGGSISANGGGGEWVDGGGGAGGRIALRFTQTQFAGSLSAVGAGGAGVGGAGTIYLKAGNANGEVRIINGARGEWTPITSPLPFNLTLDGNAIVYATEPLTLGTVVVGGAAMLTHATGSPSLTVTASGNVAIAKDAGINVDGRGYPAGGERGPGAGSQGSWAGSGAGHGGWGGYSASGMPGGTHYGSILQPATRGSQGGDGDGGAGGAGGGVIRLSVGGTLDVAGRLSACGNGAPVNNAGGGSGGSIWITTARLTGAGTLIANGGSGEWVDGGGGSGGRVAVYFGTNEFSGVLAANAAGGSQRGGAGTVFTKRNSEAQGELLVENGGGWGNYTPISTPAPFRLVVAGRAQCFPEGALEVQRFTMPGEAVLTHLTGQTNLVLHVRGDAVIAAGAQVTVDGRGYPNGDVRGPGAGNRLDWAGGGGSHGGWGGYSRTGAWTGTHYDSVRQPVMMGSQGGDADGGPGTAGGGAVRMIVDGKLTVDGRLTANGAGNPPNDAGGGAGGSLWLTVGSLSGTGMIAADGGAGEWVDGGGGGGGRIAIEHGGLDFAGALTAYGGGGNQRGGAGTIYVKATGEAQGRLLVDNGGVWGNQTPLDSVEAYRLVLQGRAVTFAETALTLTRLELPGEAVLQQLSGQTNLTVHVLGDLVLGPNSEITAEGRGFPLGTERGPGAGNQLAWSGAGASHAGLGGLGRTGASAGAEYGSLLEPTMWGSQGGAADGGPGTAGGGCIRLIVDGTLTADGVIDANGAGAPPNDAGGGSGGSLWLTVGTWAGQGGISANGGPGEWVDGGGGGGGRIAVYYANRTFTGAVTAYGGSGYQRGGAGTIYTRRQGSAYGQLLVDNGGNWGNYTPLTTPEPFQLTLASRAVAYPVTTLNVRDLTLQNETLLTHLASQTGAIINVANDATIVAGASFSVDGCGYASGAAGGPGAGTQQDCCGGGGGHGGRGGVSVSGGVGGLPYDSITDPTERGSAGGGGSGGLGGAGGGAIRLSVAHVLTVDGRLSAQGANGTLNDSGGGAGGSILVTAGTIAGTGAILADGGAGEWVDGGGGGGGRIALRADSISFNGELAARGGGGRQRGGAGSIYRKLNSDPAGDLVLNNGGNAGALTPFSVPANTRLVLSGGATFHPTGPLDVVSLRLAEGATLTHLNSQSGLTVTVAQDLTVAAGAAINVDALGYPVGNDPGPGAGAEGGCCGGGGAHGGNGGVSNTGAAGGSGYDSVLEPVAFGSSGAGPQGSGMGGRPAGGGAIHLIVGGQLLIDGNVTANGASAWANDQGGGAGGSVWLQAGRLAGAGQILADGGGGEWVDGGSGGGGRIALHLGTNAFTGVVAARGGGGGRQVGGAGTVYTRLADEAVGTVEIDNADRWGALTPLATPEAFRLFIRRSARVYGQERLLVQSLSLAKNAILTHLKGDGGVQVTALGDMEVEGQVLADGLGYPVNGDPGPGVGAGGTWAGGGAGHGGDGGSSASGASGGPAYGSELEPSMPGSQGGPGSSGYGTDGGGVIRILAAGTLTVNGSITANALGGPVNDAGGGSGGSILVNARTLTGSGEIRAQGGPGEWVDGGSGAGGRIAVYRDQSSFNGAITAEGAGGAHPGANGTVYLGSVPALSWLSSVGGWTHGTVPLEIGAFVSGTGPFTAEFTAWREGAGTLLGRVPAVVTAILNWDTTRLPDGPYMLTVALLDAHGTTLATTQRAVTVNNAVIWHKGQLTASATWDAGAVHVITGELVIPNGLTLTLSPGIVVKCEPGARLVLQSGARLVAVGTAVLPITLTSLLDDTVGGDDNLDGGATRPLPGSWRLVVNAGATLEDNAFTWMRYNARTFGGVLAASDTWTGDTMRLITETVVVPAGITLTLDPGAVLKFEPSQGLTVQNGGHLVVRGNATEPVILTSARDDTAGGDSNADGTRTKPAAGDWRSVRFEAGAAGEIDHAEIRFGGNSVGNPWGAGGVIEALGSPLTVRNSVIADALKDGAFCYGTTRFENDLVLRCDRGLTAVGDMTVLNCTLDGNRIGLLEHVGHLIIGNTIVANSLEVGIEHDLGGYTPTVSHCNVWNPGATAGNYRGTADRTGSDGNLSAAPRYKNASADNFRLTFGSPGIDAADGTLAPATDAAGLARYDDPRTGNTGTPAANGAVPDMGAFEFVESAPSNIDLVAGDIAGPLALTAGETVHLEWTVANRGTEACAGPWHDAIYLRNAATGQLIAVDEPLVGRTVTLLPGQVHPVAVDVRVPGGVTADYEWVVVCNSRGDIFEGPNAANNQAAASRASSLTVPILPLDGPAVAGRFQAQEQAQWFQCTAPTGRDVRLALNAANGVVELYVGRGFVPTVTEYTARHREWNAAAVSAVASGDGTPTGPGASNVFYVVAVGRVLPSVPGSFTISAVTAPFRIESVFPAQVGNAGLVTLQLRGAGFRTNTAFAVRLGAEVRNAVRQSVRSSGLAYATFDLTGLAEGRADVAASAEGLAHTLAEAVEVQAGGAADFYASVSGPARTRAGRSMPWFVTYGNRGSVDMKLPLLRFRAPGATEIRLYESTLNWADSFTFWGLNPEVLLPTLGPGQEVTFAVDVKSFASGEVRVEMMDGDAFAADSTSINWAGVTRPVGADPTAWADLINALPGRLGATLGEYSALLERDLESYAASPIRYSYLANINGRWLCGNELGGHVTPFPLVVVPEDYQEPASAPGQAVALGGPKPADGIRNTWWVVITLEDYEPMYGTDDANLPGTAVDARDMQDYAIRDLRTPPDHFQSAHDAPGDRKVVTRDTMLQGIRSLKGQVDADDNLVVVYSGHGGRKPNGTPYLVFDRDYASPVAFTQAIDEVGAGTTYFVNNSCHSEGFNELVQPAHTKFVGIAATARDRVAWCDDSSGGVMISSLKSQLRKCNGLGRSFELAAESITKTYSSQTDEVNRQQPVLTNPSGASLDGKPWNHPAGIDGPLGGAFRSPPFPGVVAGGTFSLVGSVDPNDKYALAGAGPEHWVNPDQVLPYEVVFENKPTAAAPAQEVLVTDDLDPNYDWSTFELRRIAFNDAEIVVPPGHQQFHATATVRTDPNPVSVDVSFNPATGRITWLMRSLDPATGELPEDPFAGFLPPNDASHRGEGLLSYTVRPKLDLADGTRLKNRATITFDPTYGANPPIPTPTVTNSIDALPPSSRVLALPAPVNNAFLVSWEGTDAPGGSGLASYDIYVSRNQGAFVPWLTATTNTSATFNGQAGASYQFYSVARDAAGNAETPPAQSDANLALPGGTTYASWAAAHSLPANATGPDDDPDHDGLRNFEEYAFACQPLVPDRALANARVALVRLAGEDYLVLTYRRPKVEPGDVSYRVLRSEGITPWLGSTVVVPVGSPVDRGSYVEVTVRSAAPTSARPAGFLRLEVRR